MMARGVHASRGWRRWLPDTHRKKGVIGNTPKGTNEVRKIISGIMIFAAARERKSIAYQRPHPVVGGHSISD